MRTLSYSWVMMSSTSPDSVLAEKQCFPIGDGVRFNFYPTLWGVRSGAATTLWLCSYKIKWQKEQAL